MGAMQFGANAAQAVEAANALCVYCGGGVDTLTLDDLIKEPLPEPKKEKKDKKQKSKKEKKK